MPNKPPRIAVDAMGGDHGLTGIVSAAVRAAKKGTPITLVGDEYMIRSELDKLDTGSCTIDVVHASQVVTMEDKPADAMRKKKDSSIQVACRLVKDGLADGVVSAGNSGATVAAGMFIIGRIKGVLRPGMAGILPTEKKPMVLIDVGANVDSKPEHLFQYGIMADVFARDVLGFQNPRIGILTIGEEEGKGNSLVKTTYNMLKSSSLNFVGNIEGRDIFTGDVDVAVCDGFVGNVALKLSEGLAKSLGNLLKGELKRDIVSKIGAMLAMKAFKRFGRLVDKSEYGGAPLLGLKGIVLVCHGKADSLAIERAIEMAARFVKNNAVAHLKEGLAVHSEITESTL
ncbi:phosphate acyltransferase PlsX [Desulfovibrio sp. UCD-KL4C]|uniref:phosphate acyltransferase PlsX n=1 Tax=Desulfovibrio sp. UCD-KL4C TaxID=2578120 RepID=UPI0025B96C2B|nr:phosphate acyltransferase PlsX [Desulfovibrio sp. UCD-KL4C]